MMGRLLGDDLAYLRWVNGGEVRAVNPEAGVFGIIEGINSKDDPVIFDVLSRPGGEAIFSNVLVTEDGGVYWSGKDEPEPERGVNYAGSGGGGRLTIRETPHLHLTQMLGSRFPPSSRSRTWTPHTMIPVESR